MPDGGPRRILPVFIGYLKTDRPQEGGFGAGVTLLRLLLSGLVSSGSSVLPADLEDVVNCSSFATDLANSANGYSGPRKSISYLRKLRYQDLVC